MQDVAQKLALADQQLQLVGAAAAAAGSAAAAARNEHEELPDFDEEEEDKDAAMNSAAENEEVKPEVEEVVAPTGVTPKPKPKAVSLSSASPVRPNTKCVSSMPSSACLTGWSKCATIWCSVKSFQS